MAIPADHRCPSVGEQKVLAVVDLATIKRYVRILPDRPVEWREEAKLDPFVEHS